MVSINTIVQLPLIARLYSVVRHEREEGQCMQHPAQ
jgi:hypothetical protein